MKWLKDSFRIRRIIYRANKWMFNSDIIKGRFFFRVSREGKFYLISLYDKKYSTINEDFWLADELDESKFLNAVNGMSYWCDGEDFRYIGFDFFADLEE